MPAARRRTRNAGPRVTAPLVRRADYAPPAFLIDTVDLRVDLDPGRTLVTSTLAVRRNPAARREPDLVLDGLNLDLQWVRLDGRPVVPVVTPRTLTVPSVPDRFVLDTAVHIAPAANTELLGLYMSGGIYCTHCEADGFRRIAYFPDRPDVMARYTVTLVADLQLAPVLLSNGNRVDAGGLADGRHFATFHDPFPKPCYLFALVAGRLDCLDDRFTTRSGREVRLGLHVRPGDLGRCGHAMASLKKAMRWDEDAYGLECDLDSYSMVAIDDFNAGAMENKGLTLFNARLVLADPATATDSEHAAIERVVAHEYFHNWTGNRVTCRDWFQLTLKEGLTVFRDQQFTAGTGSPARARIEQVRFLRATQFPEDAGPTAHPVRPEAYAAVNNFFTPTVYNKGAEIVRMMHTLVGAAAFRAGIELYIRRHDGSAVACEDLVRAIEDASGRDLARFRLWYAQSGTPVLSVRGRYDAGARRYELTVGQAPSAAHDRRHPPLHMPLAVGLLDPSGTELPLRLAGEARAGGTTRVLELRHARETFVFEDVPAPPVASLLRGFSAPVTLAGKRPDAELAFLMAHDTDPFARWDAWQQLSTNLVLALAADRRAGRPLAVPGNFIDAVGRTLEDRRLDPALVAMAVSLPAFAHLAEQTATVDVDALTAALCEVRTALAAALAGRWRALYLGTRRFDRPQTTPADMARRQLCGVALGYLVALGDDWVRREAAAHFGQAAGMTDAVIALSALAELGGEAADAALARACDRWKGSPPALDNWFSIQARAPSPAAADRVRRLLGHPDYDRRSPNRVGALLGAFAYGNPEGFHAASGDGYGLLGEELAVLDALNPQLAARLVPPLTAWRRYGPGRGRAMQAVLERLRDGARSGDVRDLVVRSLG